MPFICIGPVCIPWTAVMPIVLWLARPIWKRLPLEVQDAVRLRYASFNDWMQATLWDRIGWKAKPKPKKDDGDGLAPVASGELLEAMQKGVVIGLHSEAAWNEALQLTVDADLTLIVDFTAEWCGPCQQIKPRFAELAREHKGSALFVKVDVDELEEVAQAAEIMAMPTFHFYKKGTKADSMSGANNEKLTATVKKNVA
uniref:Thioredoxin domain-containing protein n=1 Tax=Haptolina brevifila TaxID=156173 RepID=A0A7S2ISI8_9EUKA|mmetsp:Transcript_70866/g.140471  ORF Transcript_70866/g.140471 Transcript_70866/m.140471 type:complete len:199 (+) Transcript_70866:64-660(+)|eukprot:CAMPEP_0174732436 /NCGR_PEP_ID=MMETSP1094-20130205/59415_1 /TAXON_ID=156173 /ORGANISM="Chrysochromulina brevifilum, Strain UTEX LB 985" /LENGTH=198 /DNA_ID=CAMNT_0015934953 /DNA_START=64 /DNA_END=660 /DNA_ORIENTATION=+